MVIAGLVYLVLSSTSRDSGYVDVILIGRSMLAKVVFAKKGPNQPPLQDPS
jgi:hypothetical protein